MFEKNILKLLDQKSKGELAQSPDSQKNLEILMAISHGINFHDSSVMSNRLSKEETVLKLIG